MGPRQMFTQRRKMYRTKGSERLEKSFEFFYSKTDFANDRSQGAFSHFLMVGNNDASVRIRSWRRMMWLPRWRSRSYPILVNALTTSRPQTPGRLLTRLPR